MPPTTRRGCRRRSRCCCAVPMPGPGVSRSTSTITRRRKRGGDWTTRCASNDAEVLSEARALLSVPLESAASLEEQSAVILGWCSAMGVLAYLGEVGDLPRLTEILD